MKTKIVIILFLSVLESIHCQDLKPIEKKIGKLVISIDPRMELLSTVQILSNYPIIDRNSEYAKRIISYFNKYSSMPAVQGTNDLLNNQRFGYDAPVGFMLHFSSVPTLNQTASYSDYLLKRGGGKNLLDQYISELRLFAKETDFAKFWKEEEEYYSKILDLTISSAGDIDFIRILESYFNESQNSYNIIISPAFKGGYGPNLPAKNGKLDVFSIISPTTSSGDIPYLDRTGLSNYVLHEFGHSFVNPETAKYPDRVQKTEKLFGPIRMEMTSTAYGSWSICLNEHILRSANIRMSLLTDKNSKQTNLINKEKANKFIYIEPILKSLTAFENLRDKEKIAFSDYIPKILDVLDSLSNTDFEKLATFPFIGPLNSVIIGQKTAWIIPTHDKDTASLRLLQSYIRRVFNGLKLPDKTLLMDTVALKTDLSQYGILAYGTIESNLFLSKYKGLFPFKLENNVLYADKEYTNQDLKLITCLPNPLNPFKGMTIYTAFYNKNIININRIMHGSEDYLIFPDPVSNPIRGFYSKDKVWTFKN
jgi:hypothetical protein